MLTQPAGERAAPPEDPEYDGYSLREIAEDIGGAEPQAQLAISREHDCRSPPSSRRCGGDSRYSDGVRTHADELLSQRHPRLPFGDVARDGRRGDGVGVGEIQLPRSRPAREVAIDRAYRHFVARLRYPRARVDAGAARWLEEGRAGLLEQLEVAALFKIALHVLP